MGIMGLNKQTNKTQQQYANTYRLDMIIWILYMFFIEDKLNVCLARFHVFSQVEQNLQDCVILLISPQSPDKMTHSCPLF